MIENGINGAAEEGIEKSKLGNNGFIIMQGHIKNKK